MEEKNLKKSVVKNKQDSCKKYRSKSLEETF